MKKKRSIAGRLRGLIEEAEDFSAALVSGRSLVERAVTALEELNAAAEADAERQRRTEQDFQRAAMREQLRAELREELRAELQRQAEAVEDADAVIIDIEPEEDR